MKFEPILLILALICGCVPLLSKRARAAAKYFVCGSLAFVTLSVAIGNWLAPIPQVTKIAETLTRPIEVAGGNDPYVGSASCMSCHPQQYDSWHASYHRTMTQTATPSSVAGDFNDVKVRAYHRDFHLSRKGHEFWVQMDDPELPVRPGIAPIDRRIVLTTGSHHMQVFWYQSGRDRRVGQLPVVWLREVKRWIPIHSIFIRPPQEHLAQAEGQWNQTCIKCHTTQGRPRIDLSKPIQVDTHVAEFGIACEACHGPGRTHVDLQTMAQDSPSSLLPEDSVIHPASLPHERSAEVCGQCHGVWIAKDVTEAKSVQWAGLTYRPGDRLNDTRHVFHTGQPRTEHVNDYLKSNPTFLEDRFWHDGMARVSGREYNGLVRSACFQRGTMSCLSCHQLHLDDDRDTSAWANDQLSVDMNGNTACLQCHQDYQDQQRLTQHTHHPPESSGSQCYNCHMPYTTYGLLKAIRSHQISSPSVEESLSVGRPNACNQCHLDKTLPWTADALKKWYQLDSPRKFTPDQRKYAATLLWCLTGDAGQRALATWTLGWRPALEASRHDWAVPVLGQLLDDPYDAVRYLAHRSLGAQSG